MLGNVFEMFQIYRLPRNVTCLAITSFLSTYDPTDATKYLKRLSMAIDFALQIPNT